MAIHVDKLRVASGYDGGYKGEFWLMATEPVGVNVRFKVVSWVEGDVINYGNSTGG